MQRIHQNKSFEKFVQKILIVAFVTGNVLQTEDFEIIWDEYTTKLELVFTAKFYTKSG